MPEDPKPEGTPAPESAPKPDAQPAPAEEPKSAAPPAAAKPAIPPPATAAAKPPAKPATPPPPKPPAVMVTTPWESDLTHALAAAFGDSLTEFCTYVGQNFLTARIDTLIPLLRTLHEEHDFHYLVDITAVHWPKRPEVFDVLYVLYSFARNERIRVKLKIKDGEKPASATAVYPTADWLEREVYDMFGVEFEGHPNMRRILMPDEWSTFPLRKENSILAMDQKWVQENLGIESGQ